MTLRPAWARVRPCLKTNKWNTPPTHTQPFIDFTEYDLVLGSCSYLENVLGNGILFNNLPQSRWQLLKGQRVVGGGVPCSQSERGIHILLVYNTCPVLWNEMNLPGYGIHMIGSLPDLFQIWLWTVCQLLGLLSRVLSYLGQIDLHCEMCYSDPVPSSLELDIFFKVGSKSRPGWAEAVVTGSTPVPRWGRKKVKLGMEGERNMTRVLLICFFHCLAFLSCFVLIIGC